MLPLILSHISTPGTMRKDKKSNDELKDNLTTELDSSKKDNTLQETDAIILEQINKRKDENQALKKLLKNLNSTLYNGK